MCLSCVKLFEAGPQALLCRQGELKRLPVASHRASGHCAPAVLPGEFGEASESWHGTVKPTAGMAVRMRSASRCSARPIPGPSRLVQVSRPLIFKTSRWRSVYLSLLFKKLMKALTEIHSRLALHSVRPSVARLL